MSKTLQDERVKWEGHLSSKPNARLVTHFQVKPHDVYISIMVEGISGVDDQMTLFYDMVRYFKIGDDWVTSCDVKSGDASDVFEKFGEVLF